MPKKPLKSWEKAEIAIEWLRPLEEGKPRTPIAELACRYGNRDAAVISRAIQAAFREGLVEIRRRDFLLPEVSRVRSLEAAIRKKYRHLEVARVIDVGTEEEAGARTGARWSDLVHKLLGDAAADILAGGLLREGDCVGLGSGRSVYFTVSALREHEWLTVSEVTLMSLTGALFPHSHADQAGVGVKGVGLDADFHVALMGTRFARPVTCLNVAYPIACETEEQQRAIRRNTPLDSERYLRHKPTLAVIGVGVLEGRHRFASLAPDEIPERILDPILEPLRRLSRWVQKYRSDSPPWVPVGDIANWLFWNPEPEGVTIPKSDKKQIGRLIGEVNKKLLTVSDQQLQKADSIMLVAGTEAKAFAIKHLLSRSDLRVRILCTDMPAARIILGS